MQLQSISTPRRIINQAYRLAFRFIDYDKFFHRLGSLNLIQNNPVVAARLINEVNHCVLEMGGRHHKGPVVLSNGIKISQCNTSDYVQMSLYFLRGYSREEQDAVAKHLSEGDIFIDVGANIGVFALMGAQHVGPTGKVIAFEPADDTAEQLAQNAALNGLQDRLQIFEYALSDEAGEMTLYSPEDAQDDLGRRSLFQSGKEVQTVQTRVFDDLVDTGEVILDRPLGVIKIDVEGAELLVLKGMRKTITTHKPKLIMFEGVESLAESAESSLGEIKAFVESCGYKVLDGNAGDGRTDKPISNYACVPA